jgi:phage terminase large subunit-like protein
MTQTFPSPTWLAKHLAPLEWGRGKQFRADPWVLDMEEVVLDGFLDKGQETYIKVSAPPQIGKSTWEEIFFPFWLLGHYPDTRIILVVYNDRMAEKSGGRVRDLIMHYGPELFNIDVNPDIAAKGKWELKGHQGGMISVGMGSSITGESADVMLIGDVIKNMKEAGSKTEKDTHWDEMEASILPRVQDGGLCLLANTRWAADDISGRIDEQMADPAYFGERWTNLRYPAIAMPFPDEEVDDPEEWRDRIGRRKGEPLLCRRSRARDAVDPENSYFHRRKRSTSTFVFDCLFQGNPTSPTGGMFPREAWGWYDLDDRENWPGIASQRRVWDLAATEGGGDWTVGGHIVKTDDDEFWIMDIQRFRKDTAGVLQHVKDMAAIDGLVCPIMIEQERSGAGKTTFAFYRTELSPHSVEPANPDGTKEERAKPSSNLQQTGRLRLPRRWVIDEDHPGGHWWSPAWVQPYIEEHAQMMGDGRSGRHDDQIDITAYAINDMWTGGVVIMEETGLMLTSAGVVSGSMDDLFG